MGTIKEKLLAVTQGKIWQSAFFKTAQLCFQEEVIAMCKQNYCGMYGKTWTCPPIVASLSEQKAKCLAYENAFVFTTKHDIEDSFDIEGMGEARVQHTKIEREIVKALSGEKFLLRSAGACAGCHPCAYPNPCRFPQKATTSMEACGISVVQLASDLGINYVNGANTVTYFSLILY